MANGSRESRGEWARALPSLGADGPDPELREELARFGQFVGDWTIDAWHPQPDGTGIKGTGEVNFR